jgi:hypothetical protein
VVEEIRLWFRVLQVEKIHSGRKLGQLLKEVFVFVGFSRLSFVVFKIILPSVNFLGTSRTVFATTVREQLSCGFHLRARLWQ